MTATWQRREVRLGVLSVLLVAVVLGWWLARSGLDGSTDGEIGVAIRGPGSSVSITGETVGTISPGFMEQLNLSLANTNEFDVIIHQITVTLRAVDAPFADTDHPCSPADFAVRSLSASADVTIAGNRTDDLKALGLEQRYWPAVGMLNRPSNQDGCKGASLTLDYEAHGVEVN